MTLYELKMYLKRLKITKIILKNRKNKEEYAKKNLLKSNGLELIIDVENALSDLEILYFADYGTLLGIVRDQNFINWDNDIDYGLLIDDSFDWKDLEQRLNKCEFRKVREFKFKDYIREQTYCKGNLTIDFFGHQNFGNKNIGFGFFRKEDYIYRSKTEFHVRRVEYVKIANTKTVEFLGTMVHIPQNAEEYLESVYTKNWRIPDPKWTNNEDPRENITIFHELGSGIFYE